MTPNPTDANYLYPNEQDIITRSTNVLCNFYITIIIIVILSIFKRKIEFLFYSILAYLTGETTVGILTQFLKRISGKPRPYYNSTCLEKYKKSCNHSFPSGHTAYAFQAQIFLTLLLFEIIKDSKYRKHFGIRLLCLLPVAWATFVGVSRYYDYHHTVPDIIAGGCIGLFSGVSTFFVIKNKLFEKKSVENDDYFAIN